MPPRYPWLRSKSPQNLPNFSKPHCNEAVPLKCLAMSRCLCHIISSLKRLEQIALKYLGSCLRGLLGGSCKHGFCRLKTLRKAKVRSRRRTIRVACGLSGRLRRSFAEDCVDCILAKSNEVQSSEACTLRALWGSRLFKILRM